MALFSSKPNRSSTVHMHCMHACAQEKVKHNSIEFPRSSQCKDKIHK